MATCRTNLARLAVLAVTTAASTAVAGPALANPPHVPAPTVTVTQLDPNPVVIPPTGEAVLHLKLSDPSGVLMTLQVTAPTGTRFAALPTTPMCTGSTPTHYQCNFNGPVGPWADAAADTVDIPLVVTNPSVTPSNGTATLTDHGPYGIDTTSPTLQLGVVLCAPIVATPMISPQAGVAAASLALPIAFTYRRRRKHHRLSPTQAR